jgi:hypothetical protein
MTRSLNEYFNFPFTKLCGWGKNSSKLICCDEKLSVLMTWYPTGYDVHIVEISYKTRFILQQTWCFCNLESGYMLESHPSPSFFGFEKSEGSLHLWIVMRLYHVLPKDILQFAIEESLISLSVDFRDTYMHWFFFVS